MDQLIKTPSLLSSFDSLAWKERVDGDAAQGFYVHVRIGSLDFHALAIPVHTADTGDGGSTYQAALSPQNEAELMGLYSAWEPGEPFRTAQVCGLDCVVTFQPFTE